MDVTIIGSGNMARGIATRMLAGGSDVTILATDAAKAQALAGQLDGPARAGTAGADPPRGDVVVLAVPYSAAAEIVRGYGDALDGKVVVDITNPVNATYDGLVDTPAGSAAQEVAAAAPAGARVVKAFNTTFAGTLVAGEVGGLPLDVLIAGDDAEAKRIVAGLAEAGGLNAIDAGPLARARELEALGFLHIALQSQIDGGFGTAVKVIR